MSANNDKRIQSIEFIERHAYGTNKDIVHENEEIVTCDNVIDDFIEENKTKRNLNWPYILDHPLRIIIMGDSRSGKTNALLNLIKLMQC